MAAARAVPAPPSLPFELQGGEHIIRLCRRHWLYFYPLLVGEALIGAVLPLAVVIAVAATAGLGDAAGKLVLGAAVIWFGYWAVRAYLSWYRYRNDLWVITNQRVVDSIKRHWFHHRMASADVVDIEDMSVVREGILQTAFNFGDVRCQTAGEVPNFVLAGIPRPAEVLGVVDAARDAGRREMLRVPGA